MKKQRKSFKLGRWRNTPFLNKKKKKRPEKSKIVVRGWKPVSFPLK